MGPHATAALFCIQDLVWHTNDVISSIFSKFAVYEVKSTAIDWISYEGNVYQKIRKLWLAGGDFG